MSIAKAKEKPSKSTETAGLVDRAWVLERGRSILRAESAAVADACDRLGEAFVGAVEAVLRCKGRACVTGVGKAGLIGNKIQATFASTGTPSYSLHPVEALHGDLGMVHPDDIVVALSKSGSSELVELLPRLRGLGCRVILLTAKADAAAAKHADYVLQIGETAEACPLGLAPSSSTTAMLALGDALALTVMELKDVRAEQYASYHPGGALGRYLMKCHELMRQGEDCPAVPESATLEACYEAILKAPRRAGAACVVDAEGRLSGIITHGDFFRLFSRREQSADKPVTEVMTRDPKRVHTDERVTEALHLMRQHAIDELPVVDHDGRLVGIIDIQDLVARGYSVFDTA